MNAIELGDCKRGHVYSIRSRNLILGIFDGSRGFIGIREKLGSEYLFKEFYNSGKNPLGTVIVISEICKAPEELIISETIGTVDMNTGLDVAFDKPLLDGGKGWYFIDTGLSSKAIMPCAKENKDLFLFLKKLEADL